MELGHPGPLDRNAPRRIETGQVDVRLSTLAKLAEVFELTLPQLLTYDATE